MELEVIHYITAIKERKPAPSGQLDFNSFKWEFNDKENPLMRRCPGIRIQLLLDYCIKGKFGKCSIGKGVEKQTDNRKEVNVRCYLESTDLSVVHSFGENL
ncbi:MAG: hypothetical protein MUO21_00740 [Nitrososphaeraceae archaeon]|nr:hypothetical protein [Nitrososphaeraceae archaeon]